MGLDRIPPAGQPGEVGPRAGRGGSDRILAGLHLRFCPACTTAGEHCVGDLGAGLEAGDAHVEALRTDVGHRHDRGAQLKLQFFADPGLDRGQRLPGLFDGRAGNCHERAVAAEHERQVPPSNAFRTAEITLAPAMLTAL